MKYYVDVGGRSLVVEIHESGGVERVTLDGKAVGADLVRVGESARAYSLIVDGRSYPLELQPESGALRVSFLGAGTSLLVHVESERERLLKDVSRPSDGGVRAIASVMSGIVARVLAKEGDAVLAGTPLLIIEAMKMENEVRADGPGRVRSIHVIERARVNVGDPLVTLES